MATSPGFASCLVDSLAVERLFAALNLAVLNPSSQIEPLAGQALFSIEIDHSKVKMGSLHVAAKQGMPSFFFSFFLESPSDKYHVF